MITFALAFDGARKMAPFKGGRIEDERKLFDGSEIAPFAGGTGDGC